MISLPAAEVAAALIALLAWLIGIGVVEAEDACDVTAEAEAEDTVKALMVELAVCDILVEVEKPD